MGCNHAQLGINVQNGSFVNLFGRYGYEKIVTARNRTLIPRSFNHTLVAVLKSE
jgi:hypothetical protein